MNDNVLISENELKVIVNRLAKQITMDYADKNLLVICVLKGSVIFFSDLVKSIELECTLDFVMTSSYDSGTISKGDVDLVKDVGDSLEDFDVLLVEDIIDTGITLSFLYNYFLEKKPKSLRICTLLDKPDRRKVNVNVDYIGIEIPDKFVVGYGMDYDEKYRNLAYIKILK